MSTSASSHIIKGLFPPNSRVTFFRLLRAAAAITRCPTSVEPVKATLSVCGCGWVCVCVDVEEGEGEDGLYLSDDIYTHTYIPISICEEIAAPALSPIPDITFNTPGGIPASKANSPTRSPVKGVCSASFITTVLPAARAGPSFPVFVCMCAFVCVCVKMSKIWGGEKGRCVCGWVRTHRRIDTHIHNTHAYVHACIKMGKFQGMICPTTPMGSCKV